MSAIAMSMPSGGLADANTRALIERRLDVLREELGVTLDRPAILSEVDRVTVESRLVLLSEMVEVLLSHESTGQ